MKFTHFFCAGALLSIACGDPLVDPQTVKGLRILGAKATANDEPTAAHVEPGAKGTLSWLVVAEREREYRSLAIFCEMEPGGFGAPRCGDRFLEQENAGSTATPLTFTFELPEGFSSTQAWLSFLALCEDGEPRWNKQTQRFSCTSDDQAVVSVYHGMGAKDGNHNPKLQDDKLTLSGKIWSEPTDLPASCDSETIARVSRSDLAQIHLTSKGTDSEKLDDATYAAAPEEALTYTHVTTTAGLSRAFSAVDAGAKDRSFELELSGDEAWTDLKKSQVGTFHLVVSDGRGGADWLQRSYCLTK